MMHRKKDSDALGGSAVLFLGIFSAGVLLHLVLSLVVGCTEPEDLVIEPAIGVDGPGVVQAPEDPVEPPVEAGDPDAMRPPHGHPDVVLLEPKTGDGSGEIAAEILFVSPGGEATNPVHFTVFIKGSIHAVRYYAGGALLGTGDDPAAHFSFTCALTPGTQLLRAQGLDAEGVVVAVDERVTKVVDASPDAGIAFISPGMVAANPVTLKVATSGPVNHVRYLVDGIVLGISENSTEGFPLIHDFWGSGNRVLEARAYDAEDVLLATDAQVTLMNPDSSLTFLTPLEGEVSGPVTMTVAVTGPVARVEYWVDDQYPLGESTALAAGFPVNYQFWMAGERHLKALGYTDGGVLVGEGHRTIVVYTGCPAGQLLDCNDLCVKEAWLGDAFCDDGTSYDADFDCAELDFDGGDCDSTVTATEMSFLAPSGSGATNPVTFQVSATADIAQVDYYADGWFLGSSDQEASSYPITYTFNVGGPRTILAKGYDAQGGLLKQIQKTVDVELGGGSSGGDVTPSGVPDVPYFYQYANSLFPSASCQNTSVAMLLAWYGWSGDPDLITSEWGKNYAQSPAGLAQVFNFYAEAMGIPQRLVAHTNGTIPGLKALLAQGKPVIIHGYFTGSGHVMVTLGYENGVYTVNDPAGEWSQSFKGGYPYGWSSTVGDQITYGATAFEAAVATSDGWSFLPLWYHEIVD